MRGSPLFGWAGKLLLACGAMGGLTICLEVGARLAGYQPIHDVYSKPSKFWQKDVLLGWSHEPGAAGV